MAEIASKPAESSRTADSTVDPDEIARFSAIADEWWDPSGKFAPLHKLNPPRLRYIRDALCAHFGGDGDGMKPLKGLRILDIGCGGGLISEPLARMGATVTGIDAAERNIGTAAAHAERSGLKIDYRFATAEALAESGEIFDAVLALEIVEHVADIDAFTQACARLVRPGGAMVWSTLNRTPKSFALAIVGAEYILRWLPRGTHQWRKFVRPSELTRSLGHAGGQVKQLQGIGYDILTDRWRLVGDLSVGYMAFVEKAEAG